MFYSHPSRPHVSVSTVITSALGQSFTASCENISLPFVLLVQPEQHRVHFSTESDTTEHSWSRSGPNRSPDRPYCK